MWAKAGHSVAVEQFYLPWKKNETKAVQKKLPEVVVKTDDISRLELTGRNFSITFSKKTGLITNCMANGKNLISDNALRQSFWRPQTDNDLRGAKTQIILGEWKESETDRTVTSFTSSEMPDGAKVVTIVHTFLSSRVKWINRVKVTGDGTIGADADINAESDLPVIPKIGMTVQIPADYKNITWFGKGPQENANRTGIRWMRFMETDGTGVLVKGRDLISMSAWPWTAEQLENANHTNELPVNYFITVNIDLKQMGVGGNDSWSFRAFPLLQYQIKPGKYFYSFTMTPVSGK